MAERVLRLTLYTTTYSWRDGSYQYGRALALRNDVVHLIGRFKTRNVGGFTDRYRFKMVRIRVPALGLNEVIVEASALLPLI